MSQEIENITKDSWFMIASGVLLILAGLSAMASPFIASLSLTVVVGIMLIVGGVGLAVFAFRPGVSVIGAIPGILTVLIGIYIVMNPGNALATFTILLTVYLLVSGVFEVLTAFMLRSESDWGWILFSGIVSILLGGMLYSQFPLSGALAIGILIGFRLFFTGATLVRMGIVARGISKGSQIS